MNKKDFFIGLTVGVIITASIGVIFCLMGQIHIIDKYEQQGTSLDDCPCPEIDSDPTGGALSPIEKLQYLEINFSGYIDFTEIVEEYGQVTGPEADRTALFNVTITNNGDAETEAVISLRNKSISWSWDGLFMEAVISIQDPDERITYYLYTHRSWEEGQWYCSTYDFNDYAFTMPSGSSKTIIICYTLDPQPTGAFMDGQIFGSSYPVFGIHLGENHESWEYFPIEVRT